MSPNYAHILVGTDLSASSDMALRHALTLAQATGAKIRLLHVCEKLSDDARLTLMMFMQDDTMRTQAMSNRLEMIKQALADNQTAFWQAMPDSDQSLRQLITHCEVIEGFPAEILLQQSSEQACDMLILGAHQHGLNHTFLGSVAKRVMRRAEIPTLIVPNRGAQSRG